MECVICLETNNQNNFEVTPEKYLSSFNNNCVQNHVIKISKPYGVLLICETCGNIKSYNWMK